MSRFVRIYLSTLAIGQITVLGLAILLPLIVSIGLAPSVATYYRTFLIIALLLSAPTYALAEDRNVWRNEFRRCPKWLRIATVLAISFGILAGSIQVIFLSGNVSAPEARAIFVSAGALFIGAIPICILYSLLNGDKTAGPEIQRRVWISLGLATVIAGLATIGHLGYLPHLHLQK